MVDFLMSVLGFVVAISLLVAVHEYGHFWVARRLGFKVLRFSIGFGRPLLRWRSKDEDQVEYWISAIPVGGYVKMLDEREDEVDPDEADRAFNRRPIWARIAVLFAGPAANFVFAIAAFWLIYVTGMAGIRPYVEDVVPGSVAAEAGLRRDDVIESIGGQPTQTLEQALVAMFDELLGDGIIELDVVEDDGDTRQLALDVRDRVGELTEPDALFDGLGIVIGPRPPATIGKLSEGYPAIDAGLQSGDRIVALDDEPMRYWSDVSEYIHARPGETVNVTVDRDGGQRDFQVPISTAEEDGTTFGRIGIEPETELFDRLRERVITERHYGPVESLGVAARETWDMTGLTVRTLGLMVTGEVSLRNMSGPLMIASYAGDFVRAGFDDFLRFLSLISISLGIMNLLPVPILDGGQILMCLVEAVKGSPVSMRAAVIGQQVGLAMLIVLTGFVFYNDITRMFGL